MTPAVEAVPAELASEEAFLDAARRIVASGRVVPGLTVEEDRGRSWWWPLPSASQRGLVRSLVLDPSPEGQRQAARRLGEAVDATARASLVASGVSLAARRPGRPTVPEAWLRALCSEDPWLPTSLSALKVRALADAVAEWVRSGAVLGGRARLCLRLLEPAGRGPWAVELLVQDYDEPSLLVPLGSLWTGDSPFDAPAVMEDVLRSLGRCARLAPELAPMLDEAAPTCVVLDEAEVVALLRDRVAPLGDVGIAVQLPAWWTHRSRLGLRAKVRSRSSSSPGPASSGAPGMDALLDFDWQAALGTTRLTKRDLAALEKAALAKRSLVRLRGEWVAIDPTEVGGLLGMVGTSGEATTGDLLRAGLGLGELGGSTPASSGAGAAAASDGLGTTVLGVDATALGWLAALLDDALHATVEPIATPEGFEGELRPYQERGAGWLAFLGRLGLGACLADDMGLGKTAQLIAAELADPGEGPTLVVCPVSVLGNWERELARFAPGLAVMVHHGPQRITTKARFAKQARSHDVVLSTYSLVGRDAELLGGLGWGRLVLDEAQQVKNPGTAQARAVRGLEAQRRVALTGTPVENRLSELWSIMHILNPGLLGSARSFRERFATPIERDHDEEATELLRRVTGPFILRRLKTDRSIISDLPDKIETVDRCPLTREQASLYRAVVDDLLTDADESEGIARRGAILAGLLRLKQVCNHPAHFLADASALSGRSGKLARTEELLEEILAEGDKVLCFTQFTAWGELLVPYLHRRFGEQPSWLHGGVRRAVRDEMVERFQADDGPRMLLISLKAGGTGLNLTAASHVIHLDRWWNPAVEDQATDRAYRIGQRRTVQVHKLVTTGTVEERIHDMITEKRDLAERVVGTGEDWLTDLSTGDLRDLVALSESESG